MKPKVIVSLIVLLLAVIILFQNTQTVTLRFLFWQVSMSQVILMVLTLLIGFSLGYLATKFGKKHPQ